MNCTVVYILRFHLGVSVLDYCLLAWIQISIKHKNIADTQNSHLYIVSYSHKLQQSLGELWPQTVSHAINCFSVVIGSLNTFWSFLIRSCFQIKDSCSEFVYFVLSKKLILIGNNQINVHVFQNPCSLGAVEIFHVKSCSLN